MSDDNLYEKNPPFTRHEIPFELRGRSRHICYTLYADESGRHCNQWFACGYVKCIASEKNDFTCPDDCQPILTQVEKLSVDAAIAADVNRLVREAMTDPTPAEAAKLLPCPFCGHPPTVGIVSVGCYNPFCRIKPRSNIHETLRETVAEWNTRQQPAPPAGEPDRKAFEAWFQDDAMPLEHSNWFRRDAGGPYEIDSVEHSWRGWEAASRLGAASRPKVEDAVDWRGNFERVSKHLQYEVEQREATEAELAKAHEVLREIGQSGPVNSSGANDSYAGWSWCYDRANKELERHAAHRQQEDKEQ